MTTEFTIDLDEINEGLGELYITDASVLIRPRKVPGQYPASVPHDTVHANGILCLGDDMGAYTTHIITSLDPQAAHKMLDRVFYAFIDACCFSLWRDARVSYQVNGEEVRSEWYGFEDGSYTQRFNVHCQVPTDKYEEHLASLTSQVYENERFVVVRPDSSELGYTARGFTVVDIEPDEYIDDDDEEHGMSEAEESDLRIQDCCGQPYYDCTCAELASFRAFHADPATAGSWWTA